MAGEDLAARAAGEPLSEAAQAIAQSFVRPCQSMFGPIRALVALERRRLERSLPVLLIEPEGALLALMGRNPMDLARAAMVARAACEATQSKLDSREARALLRRAFCAYLRT